MKYPGYASPIIHWLLAATLNALGHQSVASYLASFQFAGTNAQHYLDRLTKSQ